ncbi:MAG: hemolysin family protein, partial [Polyangiales bacterium]
MAWRGSVRPFMWGVLAAIALVALNAFFVGAEFAMVRARPQRFERLKRKGSRRAAMAHAITSDLEKYLPVSQVGITLASLGLGWIGEPAIARQVDGLAVRLAGHDLGPTAHGAAIGIAFAVITYFHVLLGEQMPKMIALHQAEEMALALAIPLRVAYVMLYPALIFLSVATRFLLGALGLRGDLDDESKLSEEDMMQVIAATLARGRRAEDKRRLLERVVRFGSRQARHAMVPRVDVAYLPIATKGSDAIAYLRAQEYTRVVLVEGHDLDRVVGYLYGKDLLLDPHADQLVDLKTVRRDVLFAPEPQSLIDVLRAMQRSHTLFAIVVDE